MTIDMMKIQIKSERLTPFGGLFSIMEQFVSTLSSVIDSTLDLRCRLFGYGIAGKDGACDIRRIDCLCWGGDRCILKEVRRGNCWPLC